MDKARKWRKALMTVANLSGFDYSNKKGTLAELLNTVVDDIRTKLIRKSSFGLNGLVGIESRIEEVEFLLCLDDSLVVSTVGIWGMGGVGKTTLAESVYHRLSSKFDACCLLKMLGRDQNKQMDEILWLKNTS